MHPGRLLLILTEFPPRIGGMQAHAAHLAAHLHASGRKILVATYRVAGDDVGAAEHDAAVPYRVERVLNRFGHFRNLELLEELVATFRPDLVYASTVFFGELSARTGVPIVCRSVGNDVLRPWIGYPFRRFSRLVSARWFERSLYRVFRSLERPELLDALLRRRRRQLMVDAARRHAHVLANSRFTLAELRAIGVHPARLTMLPGGVDADRFEPDTVRREDVLAAYGVSAERHVVLTACRFEHKKGVDVLIDALPALLAELPEAHLVIAGTGRLERRLRRQAAGGPAADRVTFTGAVPHPEVHRLFAVSDVFVLASRIHVDARSGLTDAETMGRVLCEANAAGIPVVATRSGGIPSVVTDGDNGLLVPEDDPDAFVRAVVRLAREPDLAAELVRRGRERALREFDWSVVMDAHERCFRRVLAQSGAERPDAPAARSLELGVEGA